MKSLSKIIILGLGCLTVLFLVLIIQESQTSIIKKQENFSNVHISEVYAGNSCCQSNDGCSSWESCSTNYGCESLKSCSGSPPDPDPTATPIPTPTNTPIPTNTPAPGGCSKNEWSSCSGGTQSCKTNNKPACAGGGCSCYSNDCSDGSTQSCGEAPTSTPTPTNTPIPTNTPTPTPAHFAPKGYHDGVDCSNMNTWGWSCDQDDYNRTINVDMYVDGSKISTKAAGDTRGPGVAGECGGNENHGFNWTVPASYKDGAAHSIKAVAIDTEGNGNTELPSSSAGFNKTFTCTPPGPTNLNRSCSATSSEATFSWTGVSGINDYILRIDKNDGYSDPVLEWNPMNRSTDQWICVHGTSSTRPIVQGSAYNWWEVQSSNSDCSARYGVTRTSGFTCAAPPTNTPTTVPPTPTPTTPPATPTPTVEVCSYCTISNLSCPASVASGASFDISYQYIGTGGAYPYERRWLTRDGVGFSCNASGNAPNCSLNAASVAVTAPSTAGTYTYTVGCYGDSIVNPAMCYLNADDRESCDVTVNTVSTPTATPTTVPNTPTPTATPTPTPTATPTPIPGFQAYIQAYDADVHSQTSINLQAPPTGGYIVGRNIGAEGIVSRGTGSDLKGYSATNWKSTTDWPIISNNSYFPLALLNNKVPDSTAIDNTPCSGKLNTGCVNSNNPLYDHVSGPLTVENLNVASGKKAVIYVEGNINITENITVNNNGFLMLIATGNINIDKDVTEIQGLYYAGGTFSTGNNLSGYESQLELEGIFIAEKFSLERNLDPASAVNNSNAPAEKFYYKPSLLFSAPEFLQVRYTLWEEVAP